MYESVTIKHFRGIEDLTVENLSRVNLIVGRNNAGKTTVLEALLLLGGGSHASAATAATRLGELRGQSGAYPQGIWVGLFSGQDAYLPIEISGRKGQRERRLCIAAQTTAISQDGVVRALEAERIDHLEIRFEEIGPDGQRLYSPTGVDERVPATFLPAHGQPRLASLAEQLSRLVKAKREHDATDMVRLVDPRITRLVVGTEAGNATVLADMGLPELLPLALAGQGTVRVFSWAVELAGVRGGLLLIDDIDDGLHHTIMVDVLKALRTMAEMHDVQIFATTHNDEIIRGALEAFSDHLEQLRIIRVGRKDNRSIAAVYDERSLPAVLEGNLEVRG
jgi:predicted ATPase